MSLPLSNRKLLREQAFIAGQWVGADDRGTLEVTNPATGTVVGRVPRMGAVEARRAIEAAHAAFGSWRALTAKERARILRRWYELMQANREDLARLMTAEQGKPLAEARGEIDYASGYIEWFSEEARRLYGDVIPAHQADKRVLALRSPLGVCAGITPWNFPAAMIARKVAPALAAGCTMVIKPAEQTPLSALALAVLAQEAGVPAGVFSVVTSDSKGAPAVGGELTGNPLVKKLSFTGSTEVGKLLMRQCADTVKKLSLELGGNAPFIVFDDADVEQAVAGAMVSKFRNTGQTCVCANRFLVQAGIHDAFVERLAAATAKLKVGDGMEPDVQQGPLIDAAALRKVQAHVADAIGLGAVAHTGGKVHALGGTFYQPTVLSGVSPRAQMLQEETFGPVAGVVRFTTEDEAVALANATPFGLAAYFYSRDNARIWRTAEALEVGMVGVNTGLISTEVAPFGGVKESGFGREGSKYGMDDYCSIKYVCLGGIDSQAP